MVFKSGRIPWNKGLTKNTSFILRDKGIKHTERWNSLSEEEKKIHGKRISEGKDIEERRESSDRMKIRWKDGKMNHVLSKLVAHRNDIIEGRIIPWNKGETKETNSSVAKISEHNKKHNNWSTWTPEKRKETIDKRQNIIKELRKDPKWLEQYWLKVYKARNKRPNGIESQIIKLNIPGVEYTGSGTFFINFGNSKVKNPDFIIRPFHINKKAIELFGDYWHRDENPQDLIDSYGKVGVDCLVIWEKEIKSDLMVVKNRILSFIGRK